MNTAALEAVVAAPPSIRALAKVIHDVDHDQFAELFDQYGIIKKKARDELIKEVQGELSEKEQTQFNTAFVEYSQQLRGIDHSQTAKNKVGEGLIITSSIDSECVLAGIGLATVLDAVMVVHNFYISIVSFEVPTKHRDIFHSFAKLINSLLSEILVIVRHRSQHRHEVMDEAQAQKLISLNSRLWFYSEHMQWYVGASKQTMFFDARDHIHDISAVAVWKQFVGLHVPACTTEQFAPALQVFPEWSREPIRQALDYMDGGIVSVYSLIRLLHIWGPFLLLDRNLQRDTEKKLLCLTSTTQELQGTVMASAPVGSYVVTISRNYGLLDVLLVTPRGVLKKIDTDHSLGAWVLKGITPETFETMSDACAALPDIFTTPMGTEYEVPPSQVMESNDAYSILHRACFRNNFGYVRNLLERGGTVLVNTAVADPSITKHFTWTPMMCAVNNPNGDPVDIIATLIENGAEVDYSDEAGCTALYYAIVNNYPKTVRLLLQKRPTLPSSHSTVPLLLALGSHWFNTSDLDNRRVTDLVPHAKLIEELLPYTHSWEMTKAALHIIEHKMVGKEYMREDCPVHWNFANLPVPKRTEQEVEIERRCIVHHTAMSAEYVVEMKEVVRTLRMHCFLLSCRDHIEMIKREVLAKKTLEKALEEKEQMRADEEEEEKSAPAVQPGETGGHGEEVL